MSISPKTWDWYPFVAMEEPHCYPCCDRQDGVFYKRVSSSKHIIHPLCQGVVLAPFHDEYQPATFHILHLRHSSRTFPDFLEIPPDRPDLPGYFGFRQTSSITPESSQTPLDPPDLNRRPRPPGCLRMLSDLPRPPRTTALISIHTGRVTECYSRLLPLRPHRIAGDVSV